MSGWENFTKVSGTRRMGKRMELEFSSGLMALNMKAYGRKTKLAAREE